MGHLDDNLAAGLQGFAEPRQNAGLIWNVLEHMEHRHQVEGRAVIADILGDAQAQASRRVENMAMSRSSTP